MPFNIWTPAACTAKSYLDSLLITVWNIYMRPPHGYPQCMGPGPPHGSPRCICYFNTWTALGCRLKSTKCFFHKKTVPSRQGHHYGGTLPGFFPSSTKAPRDMLWPEFEPRPPALQASTISMSYPDSLLITNQTSTWDINMATSAHVLLCHLNCARTYRPNSKTWFLHGKTVLSRRGHHYGGTWPGWSPSY